MHEAAAGEQKTQRIRAAPLILLTSCFFLNFSSRIILAPLLPAIEQGLSLRHGQAGSFFLLISCGYFLALTGSGFVSSRLGHRNTIFLSLVAIGTSLGMVAVSPTLLFMQLCFFLLGLASGLYLPSAVATITSLFPPGQWGRAFGVHEIAPNLAFLTTPLVVAALLPTFSWRLTLLVLAMGVAVAGLVYLVYGPGRELRGSAPNLSHCRQLWGTRHFWHMVILFSMGITGTLGVYSVLPTFLVAVHAMAPGDANVLVGLSRSATLITALLGGWVADRYGNRLTMMLVLLMTGIVTVLLGLQPPDSPVAVLVWLQPLVAVCFFPPGFSLLAEIGEPSRRNLVISLVIPLAFLVGGGLVPALVTRLADFGYFRTGLQLTGLYIAAGTVLLMPRGWQRAR